MTSLGSSVLVAACGAGAPPAAQSSRGGAPRPVAESASGVCMSDAATWEAAREWAASFRMPTQVAAPPRVDVEQAEVSVGARQLRLLAQLEAHVSAGIGVVRHFVFVDRGAAGFDGCAIAEERSSVSALAREAVRVDGVPAPLDASELVGVRVRTDSPTVVETHAICRVEPSIACVTFRDDRYEVRGAGDALVYEHGAPIRRARIPFRAGDVRRVDGDVERPVVGRSAASRAARPDAPAASDAGTPLPAWSDADAATERGAWRDGGTCISGASSMQAAMQWAEAYRGHDDPTSAESHPVEVHHGDVAGVVRGKEVKTLRQQRHFGMSIQERQFVMIATDAGVASCLVSDEHLEYGYVQAPQPVRGSLDERGADGFTYRTHHEWFDVSTEREEADGEVVCALRSGELGCVAYPTRTVRQEYDAKTRNTSSKTTKATVVWRGDQLTWSTDTGKTTHAKLLVGTSQVMSHGGEVEALRAPGSAPR